VVLSTVAIVFGVWLLSQKEKSTSEPQKKVLVKGVVSALATVIIWAVSITIINMAVNFSEKV